MNEETTEQQNPILKAIAELAQKIDDYKKDTDAQLEVIREGIAFNHARFDQIEAISLDAKSVALQTRSHLIILTEEIRQMKKETVL